ncbi:MAG: lytic transglycosylase domain-containing protein [Alphaproteobacteria bacterium]|nr:lytic transglycosylase domain-containing protein [Alphaproteobacteria bacterium]
MSEKNRDNRNLRRKLPASGLWKILAILRVSTLRPGAWGVLSLCVMLGLSCPTFALARAESAGKGTTNPNTKAQYKRLLEALDRNQMDEAYEYSVSLDDPLLQKYAKWYRLARSPLTTNAPAPSQPPLGELQKFIRENPHWPELQAIQDQVELAMITDATNEQFVAFFADHLPRTRAATVELGRTLISLNRPEEGAKYIRRAWINWDWNLNEIKDFLAEFKAYLRPVDHSLRLENLLWGSSKPQIRFQLTLVSPLDRVLAEARLKIQSGDYTPEAAVANVPAATEVSVGMRYDLIRWFRLNNYRKKVLELLDGAPHDPNPDHADLWWDERNSAINTAINSKQYDLAYRLASQHGLSSTQSDFVQAEFLSGWITLKWLDDHDLALSHFVKLVDAATLASSYARGCYWAGQAMEAARQPEKAKEWYRKAAAMVTTYYGQIAAVKLGINLVELLPTTPPVTAEQRQEFESNELVRIVRRLVEIDARRKIDSFVLTLAESVNNPVTANLLAGLCIDAERLDLAVQVSRIAQNRKGIPLVKDGFPVLPMTASTRVESALIYALIRQESSFSPGLTSPVGARGLMQIMPATAREIARDLRIPYHRDVLLKKLYEAPLNLQLGEDYLWQLLKKYNGSYVMAIAAYNAGPGRMNQWVQVIGDPREKDRDVVAWVEQIPILETRLYVQKILESLQIYRILMARNNGIQTTKAHYIMQPPSAKGAWCLSGCLAPNRSDTP